MFAIKRNHDMSKVAPFDFDFSWFAKEYNEVLKRLPNVDILGGWCVGGAISYEMSLINPTKFKHLLFINSSSPVNNSSEPTKLTIDSELKILSQYVDFPLDNLPTSNLESFWEAVVGALDSNEELRLKLVRSLPPEAIGVLPPLDRQCALVTIYYINHLRSAYEAREHYKGSSKSNSSVLYLNAVDESMPNYSNWKNYVCRFEYIDVLGNHVTMFSNKNVSIWCNDFNKYINEIV